jgi:hypothetical protein
LKDALPEGGLSAGGGAFGEAGVDGGFGTGVGKEQMFDDLLDAPFVWVRGWMELGLVGIESAERGGDLALELKKGGIHSAKLRYTAGAGAGEFFLASIVLIFLLKFSECFFGSFCLFAIGVKFEISLVLGDGFIFFLHLLRDFGESEVGGGVVGLHLHGIFGAEVSALIVFIVQVEL